jgi:hypothetical protein
VLGTENRISNPKAHADGRDERDHQSLDEAKAFALQHKDQKNIQGGEAYSPKQGNMKQQVESDGGADDFRQVAGCDGDLQL